MMLSTFTSTLNVIDSCCARLPTNDDDASVWNVKLPTIA